MIWDRQTLSTNSTNDLDVIFTATGHADQT
jgi:hypothetical protein